MKRATKKCIQKCAEREIPRGLSFPHIKIGMPRISVKMPALNLNALDMLLENAAMQA